ncbi:MAG: formate dehydrogenase family accessory protein FdhD [Chloroflexi bacterium RBG_16_54_11]|nr:MAG: formate dehydrogenase family accessory protein FdhD [Chloroflexi bacterium RBG_16_54_11]
MKTISYHGGRWKKQPTEIISEQAVTLSVNNAPWLTFMCTPVCLEELGIGFLYNEEIIQSMQEVASVRVCPSGDIIDIWLNQAVQKPDRWMRTSGCSGGETSVDGIKVQSIPAILKNEVSLKAETIGSLITQLINAQELYKQSGGIHTSALSDGETILVIAEDIGRHNTLDKLAGKCLMGQLPSAKPILLTTGRVSSEMMQKSGRIGARVVISRTSPTSLSVKMAEQMGITLIGYARLARFTIYTHPERVDTIPMSARMMSEAR